MADDTGRTNGLTNGAGPTSGRTNGVGRTNGLARGGVPPSRHRGVVRLTNHSSLRANTYGIVASSDIRRTATFIALSVVAMLVLAYFLRVPAPARSPFSVDGNFSEWTTVPLYTYSANGSQANGDLASYGFHGELGHLFVYGRTVGPLFAGVQPSVVYVEIDDPARQGYAVPGFDADYIAQLWGSNNTLEGTTLREWSGAADRDNSSALRTIGSVPVALVGNQIELDVRDYRIDFMAIPGLRLRLVSEFANRVDSGATVGLNPGALVVAQTSLTATVTSTVSVLEVRMRALATDLEVSDIALNRSGGGQVQLPAFPFTVLAGQERIVQVSVDVSALPPLTFVTFEVSSVTARAAGVGNDVPVTITGRGVQTYVQNRPVGHLIDGLFDDWPVTVPDSIDSVPASIDLRASAFAVDTDAFFYVRTQGGVMTGAIIPERRVPLTPAQNASSPPLAQPRRAGEDLLQIYLESGGQPAVGPAVGGITADRHVDVRGRAGRITSTAAYAWNDTAWSWEPRSDPLQIAFVGSEFEASIAATFFTPTNNSRVVYAMSDWSGEQDQTDLPIPRTAPSLKAGAPSPLHSPIPNNITATPLVNTPAVDGNCASFPGEYLGGSTGANPAITFTIGSRDDTQNVFVCIRVTADTTRSGMDWGEVIFDTDHDGGTAPQVDDKLFWVFGDGDNVLKAWQGNGIGWAFSCPSCDPGNLGRSRWSGGAGGNEFYEFRINYTDVWNASKPAAGQVAGFAIIAFDSFGPGQAYGWGGNPLNEAIPDTWGHVFYGIPIPEFPSIVLVAVGALVVPVMRRRFGGGRKLRNGPSLRLRWPREDVVKADPIRRT